MLREHRVQREVAEAAVQEVRFFQDAFERVTQTLGDGAALGILDDAADLQPVQGQLAERVRRQGRARA